MRRQPEREGAIVDILSQRAAASSLWLEEATRANERRNRVPENPRLSSVKATIDAKGFWTGEPQRDAHLRSPDLLDVERYPQIIYTGDHVELIGDHDYIVTGELTIRGVTRSVPLRVRYLGQWRTAWWEEKDGRWIDKGPRLRAGFVATSEINRHDFGVSWNDRMDKGGVVVGDTVWITIDVEAVWESS